MSPLLGNGLTIRLKKLPLLTVFCLSCSSLPVFEAEHSALLESQATIVVRFDDSDVELVFVPVKVKTGDERWST
jgi:hypothetical protein